MGIILFIVLRCFCFLLSHRAQGSSWQWCHRLAWLLIRNFVKAQKFSSSYFIFCWCFATLFLITKCFEFSGTFPKSSVDERCNNPLSFMQLCRVELLSVSFDHTEYNWIRAVHQIAFSDEKMHSWHQFQILKAFTLIKILYKLTKSSSNLLSELNT